MLFVAGTTERYMINFAEANLAYQCLNGRLLGALSGSALGMCRANFFWLGSDLAKFQGNPPPPQ